MSNWNQNAEWTPSAQINNGKAFAPADGLTAQDMNAIIQNMLYLKKHGNEIRVSSASARVEGNTLFLSTEEV